VAGYPDELDVLEVPDGRLDVLEVPDGRLDVLEVPDGRLEVTDDGDAVQRQPAQTVDDHHRYHCLHRLYTTPADPQTRHQFHDCSLEH